MGSDNVNIITGHTKSLCIRDDKKLELMFDKDIQQLLLERYKDSLVNSGVYSSDYRRTMILLMNKKDYWADGVTSLHKQDTIDNFSLHSVPKKCSFTLVDLMGSESVIFVNVGDTKKSIDVFETDGKTAIMSKYYASSTKRETKLDNNRLLTNW